MKQFSYISEVGETSNDIQVTLTFCVPKFLILIQEIVLLSGTQDQNSDPKEDQGLATLGRKLLFSHVRLFATPWTAALEASLSFTISWRLLKLMSIESVMPFNHLILHCPLLLLPSVFSSIRVSSSENTSI